MAGRLVLIVEAQSRLIAISIGNVEEVMRPLPASPVPGTLPAILGVAVVRGRPTPLVDLGVLLGMGPTPTPRRLITLRIEGGRWAGLVASSVPGLRWIAAEQEDRLPSVCDAGPEGIVEGLMRLDEGLVSVLRTGRVLSETTWQALEERWSS